VVIYIWPNGDWCYQWEAYEKNTYEAKAVDLDKWYDYDLTDKEVLACLEAIEE